MFEMTLMKFSELIKKYDRHKDYYTSLTEIIKELQPIAFLISASLILAVFFKENSLSQKYALFASILFFLAYLGLAAYKTTKFNVFFYWGLLLIATGISYIYDSFGGIISIILNVNDKNFQLIIFFVIFSIFIVLNGFLLHISDKNTVYKFNHIMFWIGILGTLIFVPVGVYFNINGFFLSYGLLLICFILSTFNILFSRRDETET